MRTLVTQCFVRSLISMLLAAIFLPAPLQGAVLYKSYLIRQARGFDILSDPYIVLKNDSVSKLIMNKGNMAQTNFSEFMDIFRQINPGVQELDDIRIGQHIFIPIKKLKKNSLPGQTSGMVTIPFVTISKLQKLLMENSEPYTIRPGDMVSMLVSRRWATRYGKESFSEGMKLFKRANPSITNLDHILPGQRVYIPKPLLKKNPWYLSLLSDTGNLNDSPKPLGFEAFTEVERTATPTGLSKNRNRPPASNLHWAASALNAKLLTKGTYHFPRTGKDDFKLDLSLSRVMKFKDGKSVIISTQKNRLPDLGSIKPFWKQVEGIYLPPQASLKLILDRLAKVIPALSVNKQIVIRDRGLTVRARARWIIEDFSKNPKIPSTVLLSPVITDAERLPEPVIRYLASHHIIIKELISKKTAKRKPVTQKRSSKADPAVTRINDSDVKKVIQKLLLSMGYRYTEQVPITFSYAGLPVKAASNLITRPDGNLLLIDFGDLLGDAIQAIRNSHLEIIQLKKREGFIANIQQLFIALNRTTEKNPTIWISNSTKAIAVSVTVPGLLIKTGDKTEVLLTTDTISEEAILFLARPGTRIIIVKSDLVKTVG